MKQFKKTHNVTNDVEFFDEETAPNWLKFGGVKDSTMCNRWFWNGRVITLEIGQTVDTDFSTIERIA